MIRTFTPLDVIEWYYGEIKDETRATTIKTAVFKDKKLYDFYQNLLNTGKHLDSLSQYGPSKATEEAILEFSHDYNLSALNP